MDCLPLVLYLMSLLLDSVISSLPAPVNLSMESVNFRHILSWDPGPGTPQGTHYKIIKRREKKADTNTPSSKTSIKLKLHSTETYELTVQASFNHTLSAESKPYTFEPVTQTKIGPANVSLLGCGNCIQINISFPEADRSAKLKTSMKKFYGAVFIRHWWKRGEDGMMGTKQTMMGTRETNTNLTNLQKGTEYCVQVETQINTNKNTEPSAVKCIFTGIVEPSRDPAILGTVAAVLIVVIGVVTTSMFGLYYTGFLCKLKATLPRALIEALSQGHTLTPERTIPDNISVNAKRERHKKPYDATAPQPADSSDEDEDEEGKMYMNRGFSSGESSGQDSVDVSGKSKESASGGSGSLTGGTQVADTVLEIEAPHGGGPKAEGVEVSLLSDGTGEVEEVCEGSGNINLFSVTLAALAVCEDEEHDTRDSPTDLSQRSDLEPLLHSHSQTESEDQTAAALLLSTQEDITELADTFSGCLNTCDGEMQHEETKEEDEDDEEEEEEFSGYMQNR